MRTRMWMTVAALLLMIPMTAAAQTKAIVVITDDGGIGEASARTARQLLTDELRSNGITILSVPELDRLMPLGEELKALARNVGAQKIYSLSLATLGQKILVRVEEFTLDLQAVQHRRLASRGVEELDKVIPRVVKSLISGKPIEESAEIDSVTDTEGKKWEKKPGEFMWGGGVMLGGGLLEGSMITYGFDLRSGYEMRHFRLNAVTGFMFNFDNLEGDGMFHAGVGASYIPSGSDWSPYFGGGFSYMAMDAADKNEAGVGANLHVGLEAFRLHRARMLVEFGAMLPFFKLSGGGEEVYAVQLYGLISLMM